LAVNVDNVKEGCESVGESGDFSTTAKQSTSLGVLFTHQPYLGNQLFVAFDCLEVSSVLI
jgi:hypothetical protein